MSTLCVSKYSKVIKRGASGASVELVCDGDDCFIRKIIANNCDKLKQQYEWLNQYSDYDFFPKVMNPRGNEEAFSYDMPYYKNFSLLHDFISTNSISDSKALISSIFSKMRKDFYPLSGITKGAEILDVYIKTKLEEKVVGCIDKNIFLSQSYSNDEIIINNTAYLNFKKVLPLVYKKAHKDNLISTVFYEIHGDLTCENILVDDNGNFILLDPNQDNLISNVSVEFAKIYQSLHSDYEYILKVKDLSLQPHTINYTPCKGRNYRELFDFVKGELLLDLDLCHEEVLFHEAVHFARMLPYQLVKNPTHFEIYYARLIILLNEFVGHNEA